MDALSAAYPNLQPFLNESQAHMLEFDAQAIEFLEALSGSSIETAPFCFQVIPNVSTEALPEGVHALAGTHRTGTWKFNQRWLRTVNIPRKGGFCGVYVVVNETDGKGRRSSNITSVRALFVELDHGGLNAPLQREFWDRFQPSILVESSPGKLHAYWLLKNGSVPLDKFSGCQQILAHRFSALRAGKESKDLPRVLRVPGFLHLKDLTNPFWVALRFCDSARIYTPDQIFSLCGIDETYIKNFIASPNFVHGSGKVAPEIRATVDPQFQEYLGAAAGNRNDAMFHYCLNYLYRHRGLTLDEAIGVLTVVNEKNADPASMGISEIRVIAESAHKRFRAGPDYVPPSPGEARAKLTEWDPVGDPEGCHVPDSLLTPDGSEEFAEMNFEYDYHRIGMNCVVSDVALADRIVQKYGERIRYSPVGGFYVYNDLIWSNAEGNGLAEVHRMMSDTFSQVPNEKPVQTWFEDRGGRGGFDLSQWMTYKKDLQSMSRLAAVETRLTVLPELRASADSFNRDADADYIACTNGIVDLSRGCLLAPDPKYKLTHICGTRFDAAAECPTWEYFVHSAMGEDPALVEYLQRVTGYFLSGRVHLQALFVCYGQPGTGKSVYLSVLRHLLGGYHTELHKAAILEGKNYENARMSSLAQAMYSRLATVQETSERDVWDETTIKQISGGDPVTAKFSHKDTINFVPRFKVCVRANRLPTSDQLDEGLWERLRFLPFQVKFRGTPLEDQSLPQKLLTELPGILNWGVTGYRQLLELGLMEPPAALAEKRMLQRESEPVRDFVAECCEGVELHKDGMKFGDFLQAYASWCRDNAIEALADKRALRQYLLGEGGFSERNARPDNSAFPIRMIDIQLKQEVSGRYRARGNVLPFEKK